ncbi:opsin-3-like [Alligator sinensis]|uniref:Opsin-3-like n=1 Tax=Alligator sinensis TaxID=38654 RepID=A0A1U7S2L5_ALLSI|nr:opsin-3-like [Alligator sinensis]
MTVPSISPPCSGADSILCSSSSDHQHGQQHSLSPTGHLIAAICLAIIGSLGFFHNLLVLIVFCRNKVLRSPINLLLINISVSDLMVCIVGTPFSFVASTQGRWLIGPVGCVWYGFVNTLFGKFNLLHLHVPSTFPLLLLSLEPLLAFGHIGRCQDTLQLSSPYNLPSKPSGIKLMSHKREQRVLIMVVVMVICFLLCWLPYGIMALVATFGKPGLITPSVSIIPSVLAKSSTVYNPVIYIFLNKQICDVDATDK